MTLQAESVRKPYLTIRPSSGWAPINFRDLWLFRDLMMSLGVRDIKLRYRQTLLGVAWVLLQPIMAAGIFTFVFALVAGMKSAGKAPYFLMAFAAQLAWNVFFSTFTKSSQALLNNAGLVSKVYFPRLVLPVSTVYSTLVDFLVALGMLLIMMPFFHLPITPAILLLPVWMVLVIFLSLGVGLYTSALSVTYRDVNYVVPIFIQALQWGSPVGYALATVPLHLRRWVLLNPLTEILEAFRWSILGEGTMLWPWLLYSAAFSVGVFLIGTYAFRRMEKKFADVI